MDFYVVLCVCLAILLTFSVGESFLKQANIKKYNVIAFLLLSVLFAYLPNIKLWGIEINLNFVLYFAGFVFMFFKTKSVKDIIKMFITFCVSLTLSVCYNSLNFLQFEFAYFQPYIILAIAIGVICSMTTIKYNTIYCGLFGAVFVSELIRSGNVMYQSQNKFCLGDFQFSTLMLVGLLSYVVCLFFIKQGQNIKQKIANKKQATKQNV